MAVLSSCGINRTGPGICSGKLLLWIVLSQVHFFPWHFFPWTSGGVHCSCFSFQTAVPSLLRITFPVLLSFVVNILTIFLALFLDFSLNLFLLFWWFHLLPVQSYVSCSTFVLSLHLNSCGLISFLLLLREISVHIIIIIIMWAEME